MVCEAKPRKRYNDPGWECDGSGLIFLMKGPQGIPVVAPAWAQDDLMSDPWANLYAPQPFTGGDHYHINLTSPKLAEDKRG